MTDRELLELAAKAAGLDDYVWHRLGCGMVQYDGGGRSWNPLTDDGDALRLVVKLGLSVDGAVAGEAETWAQGVGWLKEPIGADPYAATRRAIVRAAAAIGEEMKP